MDAGGCNRVSALNRTLAAQLTTGSGVTMRATGGELRVRVRNSAPSGLLRWLACVEATLEFTQLTSRDLSTAGDLSSARLTSLQLRSVR